jgi:hypothetical protein
MLQFAIVSITALVTRDQGPVVASPVVTADLVAAIHGRDGRPAALHSLGNLHNGEITIAQELNDPLYPVRAQWSTFPQSSHLSLLYCFQRNGDERRESVSSAVKIFEFASV